MEQENNLIEQQVVEQPQEVVEQETQEQPTQPTQQAQPVDEKERNFAALREARERAERERDEAIAYIRQLQQKPNTEQEEEVNYAPDDLVEWKAVQKKFNKLEQKLNQYEHQTAYQVTEARLKSQFQDFDQVVTKENIEALRIAYPEIAQSLHATPDIYNKAVSTYNIIKRFGIGEQQPNNLYEKQLIQKNMAKPRSVNSVSPQQGESPLNKANEFANGFLTDERKAQLWQEMQNIRRQG